LKNKVAVCPPDELFAGTLRVGHHAQDIALRVGDPGDIVRRAVRVGFVGDLAVWITVPEDDPSVRLQLGQSGFIGVVSAVIMGYGDVQELALVAQRGEGQRCVFYPHVDPLAPVLEVAVGHETAGQQPGFAQDLKSVADTDDESTPPGETFDLYHDRRETGNGTGAKVVTVGKTTRKDDTVVAGKIGIAVPDVASTVTQDVRYRVVAIPVAPGPGENDYTKSQLLVLDNAEQSAVSRGALQHENLQACKELRYDRIDLSAVSFAFQLRHELAHYLALIAGPPCPYFFNHLSGGCSDLFRGHLLR